MRPTPVSVQLSARLAPLTIARVRELHMRVWLHAYAAAVLRTIAHSAIIGRMSGMRNQDVAAVGMRIGSAFPMGTAQGAGRMIGLLARCV